MIAPITGPPEEPPRRPAVPLGPNVVLSRDEAERVRSLVSGSRHEVDRRILQKCAAMLGTDPRFREPVR